MKNIVFSLFAIALAGIAAVAATTAMLNAPVAQHIGPPASDKPATGTPPVTPPDSPSTPAPGAPPETPPPAGGKPATPAPQSPAPEAGKPGEAGKDEASKDGEIADEDPYEGIAPEDLPPDLQYDADSSVSFPTNI
jgi:hypothetical protein